MVKVDIKINLDQVGSIMILNEGRSPYNPHEHSYKWSVELNGKVKNGRVSHKRSNGLIYLIEAVLDSYLVKSGVDF